MVFIQVKGLKQNCPDNLIHKWVLGYVHVLCPAAFTKPQNVAERSVTMCTQDRKKRLFPVAIYLNFGEFCGSIVALACRVCVERHVKKKQHEYHESVPKVGYKFCLWLVWYGYGWCVIPTLIRNINRYSHMGRCPFQEYQWKVSESNKMTIPEPKNVIFPVTNRAYLAAGAGCWLFVPSTYQCKTVPTKPVE